jgi:hypothetical protein
MRVLTTYMVDQKSTYVTTLALDHWNTFCAGSLPFSTLGPHPLGQFPWAVPSTTLFLDLVV